jgi:type IV/VI secretion system ImpK/VasF family protein
MREEIAYLVYPVLGHGLRLKERLSRGEALDFRAEQSTLKGLLGSETESRRLPEFGGDRGSTEGSMAGFRQADASRRGSEQFLGIRYALACWLDEVFILSSPWESVWNEHKLEEALYRSNDRAWKFWDQARLAEARPGNDALEVVYLCVMLGFRGQLRDKLDQLKTWVKAAEARLVKTQDQEWPMPPEREPPINVPPLRGRERFGRMLMLGAAVLLLFIPVLVVFVMRQWVR